MRHRERTETPAPDARAAAPPAEPEEKGFDWWSAPARSRPEEPPDLLDGARLATGSEVASETVPVARNEPEAELAAGLDAGLDSGLDAEPHLDLAWDRDRDRDREPDQVQDTDSDPDPEPRRDPPSTVEPAKTPSSAEIYRHVQAGEEFQEIRREYRRFVFPACAAFLSWYLLYIVAAVTLPGLMARQVAGPLNVAWLLGLLQFASTFLITWLYARHARDRRDRAALGLRWETQDRLR